jgi:hypothetical protein
LQALFEEKTLRPSAAQSYDSNESMVSYWKSETLRLRKLNRKVLKLIVELDDMLNNNHYHIKTENPFCWMVFGTVKTGPFCLHCFDLSEQFSPLEHKGQDEWFCNFCNKSYVSEPANLKKAAVSTSGDSQKSDCRSTKSRITHSAL